MLMSIEHLEKYKDDFPYESIYSIEDYIRKFIKTLNIVHLSNMRVTASDTNIMQLHLKPTVRFHFWKDYETAL